MMWLIWRLFNLCIPLRPWINTAFPRLILHFLPYQPWLPYHCYSFLLLYPLAIEIPQSSMHFPLAVSPVCRNSIITLYNRLCLLYLLPKTLKKSKPRSHPCIPPVPPPQALPSQHGPNESVLTLSRLFLSPLSCLLWSHPELNHRCYLGGTFVFLRFLLISTHSL